MVEVGFGPNQNPKVPYVLSEGRRGEPWGKETEGGDEVGGVSGEQYEKLGFVNVNLEPRKTGDNGEEVGEEPPSGEDVWGGKG